MQARDAALARRVVCSNYLRCKNSSATLLLVTPYTSSYPLELGAPENSHISINLPTCAKTPGEEVPFTLPCILSGQAKADCHSLCCRAAKPRCIA